ncbi:PfaD family polyunsaturated fatty acid/polyketide biosynthesis protein [Peterkaempfera bronchialis]|uniref:PfaD family polyunsaturated fatty acid/polyketide biosynthesis protein n=1 Tax=Peterkaempfera bronchialis TaxID=2126346 RepID=A0A345T3Y4_9ACTN|nr:PfaD family polyunsaturated fatty acid/polyketide biosynthesis protein [Peterkaempfera bronchialis]AXI80689.1 PfaD family polyunsaturated fatty acid/polyketide biosynthesis protein [Peterkaempfera bronchialis]
MPVQQRSGSAPGEAGRPVYAPAELPGVIQRIREPAHVVRDRDGGLGVAAGSPPPSGPGGEIVGTLPPLYPEWLGDRSFGEAHAVRFPYVAGEMAKGIATTRMVTAMAEAEMLGFFGAAGLALPAVEAAVDELRRALPGRTNWGVNLIHSPAEPALEEQVADLLLRRAVPHVSASAFMRLTPAVVRCAATGLHRDAAGRIARRTRLMAKVSRPEVAEQFLSPAPEPLLRALVERGLLTAEEAELAGHVPVADDITVEADSGGHTDNRPLSVLLPTILALRDRTAERYPRHPGPVRIGAAGGLGTPGAVSAAFALGAAYAVTGSVNQVAVESGVSDDARNLLAQADVADVTMAPAADMFELGVKLQVLQHGTLFAARATRLYDVYRDHDSLESVPAALLARIEAEVLGSPVAQVWELTRRFWERRDPAQLARAERDPKHRMALVFRWYLGSSSRWAITGDTSRRADYQLWCGPAMGAFNRWTAGSFLAQPGNRSVVQIALNLLEGAAVLTRAHQLRTYGVPVPPAGFHFRPRPLS